LFDTEMERINLTKNSLFESIYYFLFRSEIYLGKKFPATNGEGGNPTFHKTCTEYSSVTWLLSYATGELHHVQSLQLRN